MRSQTTDWHRWALLLIDVQHDFWSPEHLRAAPKFPGNVADLLSACRQRGVAVVHVRSKFARDRSDWMPAYRLLGHIPCTEGSTGVTPLPCALEHPGEAIFTKTTFDAFLAPGLDDHLRRQGHRILLIAGLLTSFCVYLSATAAGQRGFLPLLLEDCCADDPGLHPETTAELLTRFEGRLFWRDTSPKVWAEREAWETRLAQVDGAEVSD